MKISKQELIQEASKTGFRPEILEKVWHLMSILDGISVHPFLMDKLALKGGTALNLFLLDLPRLSVDIDLNYIGKIGREEMLQERPVVEKALEAVFQREGMNIRRIPTKHAGGKWQLRYESALGIGSNLEIDLNFMFRVPLYEVSKRRSHIIGERQTQEIPLLDLHELGAGKLAALFSRQASRDLFDAHELLTKQSLDFEKFRLICLLYGGMSSKDWRTLSPEKLQFNKKELQQQLIPVLRKTALGNTAKWEDWTIQLLNGCKDTLKALFPLREQELLFLEQLWDNGTIEPSLITSDQTLITKINQHPQLLWKAGLAKLNKSSGKPARTAEYTSANLESHNSLLQNPLVYADDKTFTVIILPLEENILLPGPQRKFVPMLGKKINESNASKKIWCQPLDMVDFDHPGEIKYEHDKLYEVILMYITDATARTFVSYDSKKKNSKKCELPNAQSGNVFTVTGYFLNDWNNRVHPVTGHVYYWFQPIKGIPDDIKSKMITYGKAHKF